MDQNQYENQYGEDTDFVTRLRHLRYPTSAYNSTGGEHSHASSEKSSSNSSHLRDENGVVCDEQQVAVSKQKRSQRPKKSTDTDVNLATNHPEIFYEELHSKLQDVLRNRQGEEQAKEFLKTLASKRGAEESQDSDILDSHCVEIWDSRETTPHQLRFKSKRSEASFSKGFDHKPCTDKENNMVTIIKWIFCDEPISYRTQVSGAYVTLRQFKSLLPLKNEPLKYFFKVKNENTDLIPDYNHVEMACDDDILPYYNDAVVARVVLDRGGG